MCVTGKKPYPERVEAINSLLLMSVSKKFRPERDLYRCKHCGYWHLTSGNGENMDILDIVGMKQWVVDRASEAVKYAEENAKDLLVGKKQLAIEYLVQKLEEVDHKLAYLGAFMDLPLVDKMERWAVEQVVEWAWGKLSLEGQINQHKPA